MDAYFRALNDFLEDTSVIVIVAYLLVRGNIQALLFKPRLSRIHILLLGIVFGLVGLTEALFPGARYPYATHSLIVTFATISCGLPVGLTASLVIAVGAFFLQPHSVVFGMVSAVLVSVFVSEGVQRILRNSSPLIRGFLAGLGAQAGVFLAHNLLLLSLNRSFPSLALISVFANTFGVMLLLLVVNEARLRASSERHRMEAEHSRALVTEMQLTALRARIHPHFLFNTLNSIAALCAIEPKKAEHATVQLSLLMRRVLETRPTSLQCLGDEIEYIRSYLEIEQYRLGSRLTVAWEIDPSGEQVLIPAFSVQTLVENAINHGIMSKVGDGGIKIIVRRYSKKALIAVIDDGVGFERETLTLTALADSDERLHGLQMLMLQLILLNGSRSRLRLFSKTGKGTLACFILPIQEGLKQK